MTRGEDQLNPCSAHGCDVCCHATAMTLTAADVARLEASGHSGFFEESAEGAWLLRNVDGRCVFLAHGRCTVYSHRPEGCTVYPLILDLDNDRVVRDDFCPYRAEFRFSRRDRVRLRMSVEREESETAARVEQRLKTG